MHPVMPPVPYRQQGFSLLEVLVAIVVLGIGLLGLASLQAASLRSGSQSYERAQAVNFAYEIADIMRADREAATQATSAFDLAAGDAPAAAGVDCMADACDIDQLAAWDLENWYDRLTATLPGAQADIECSEAPCRPGVVHTVSVLWDEFRTGAADSSCPDAATLAGYDQETAQETFLSCVQITFSP